jgi:hypothetical protein
MNDLEAIMAQIDAALDTIEYEGGPRWRWEDLKKAVQAMIDGREWSGETK